MMLKYKILALLLLGIVKADWTFSVHLDSECNTTPVGSHTGDDDLGCTELTSHVGTLRYMEPDTLGQCTIAFYNTEDDCEEDIHGDTVLTNTDNGECIEVDADTSWFRVESC